jgi:hypothetical protein
MLTFRRLALMGVVMSLTALSVHADSILLGTSNPGNIGAALDVSQVIAQPFTLTQGARLSSINALFAPFQGGSGQITLQLTNSLGPETTSANVLAEQVFNVSGLPSSGQYFSLTTDLTLEVGTYYLVFSSPDTIKNNGVVYANSLLPSSSGTVGFALASLSPALFVPSSNFSVIPANVPITFNVHGSVSGTPITYVFTGTASGTVGDFSFSGALLTVTSTGNTNGVTFDSVNGTYRDSKLSTTITIAGIGTMTVTPGSDYVFDNQPSSKIGYGVTGITNCCDIIQFVNAAYEGYDLKSSIGPFPSTSDLSTGDWVNVPTSMGPLTVSSYTGTFTATEGTSITQTLEPGVQAVYSFDNNANKYKITPSPYSTGGEVLTITELPILKSNFVPPANFPNETCIPVANFTTSNGADTCVEYQADCSFGGVPGGGDCNTLLYALLESYDLPSDLPAIGGPDFLVVHGSGCPTSSTALAQSIFTDYFVTRIDPTTKGTGSGTGSCFEVTYTPGAPLITSGSTSRFVGWQSPVVDSDLNQVKAGSTRPLIFNWNDSSGNPITNLSYCNSFTTTNSGNVCQDSPTVPTPWVNLAQFVVACPGAATVNTASDTSTSTSGNSGFQNNGGGNYQFNWQTQKIWKGTCRNVQVTFDNGVTEIPATLGFKFN